MSGVSQDLIQKLQEQARLLRCDVLEMVYRAQSGHLGGSFSAADIVSALFFHHMKIDPQNPQWADRDRFIPSKGHAAPILYAALAHKGYFPREDLWNLRQIGSHLQGHPDMNKTPGVDMTSGSLGQGFSTGLGMALAAQLNNQDYHVYALLGDGELNEGEIWETAMAAPRFKAYNLIAIVDYNKVQLDGTLEEIMPVDPLKEKWEAFNWHVIEIDGHDMGQIVAALEEAVALKDRCVCIIANTVKGKGVSFMEGRHEWHGAPPNEEQYKQGMEELGGAGS
ncbi:MAG: transketolase [Limnochordia bacterium]|jgi:transketolase